MKYKLSELFELQMGKTPSRDNSEYWVQPEFPWISIADLSGAGKYIYTTKELLSRIAVEESGIKIIPANTVVMSFKLSIGKVSITPQPMYSNEAIMAFIDRGVARIKPEYLYYLLLHRDWDEGTNKAVMGKTLNKATLSDVVIDIHSIEEQDTIVTVLDKAAEVINSYQHQLRTLDTLIKARFVEMFGDPLNNEKGWPSLTLSEACSSIFGGGTPSKSHPEYFTGTIPWVSPKDMKSTVIRDSIDHITEEAIANSTTNLVPVNSVLMVIRSGILKHSLPVAINSIPVTINLKFLNFGRTDFCIIF